jgi:hypothetical protein
MRGGAHHAQPWFKTIEVADTREQFNNAESLSDIHQPWLFFFVIE